MKIGFIGLGDMGAPMVERMLHHGLEVVIWARRPETTRRFDHTAASVAETPEALGAACDLVGICVQGDTGVREVVVSSGLLSAMRPGTVLAVHSTVLPQTCSALAELAADVGVSVLDAPISGGHRGAAEGTLTVMVGGPAEAFERSRAVFETFAALVLRLGPVGAGQAAKLVNNTLLSANKKLLFDALTIGEELGIEPTTLLELLRASTGGSRAIDFIGPDYASPDFLRRTQPLNWKTFDRFVQLAEEAGVPDSVLERAAEAGLRELDRIAGI
ncbi:MAG: hypothetical protein JWL73_2025 [Actinomycetia bacterium]|nr:hypothetical protein [Actinomycetes bacterium]